MKDKTFEFSEEGKLETEHIYRRQKNTSWFIVDYHIYMTLCDSQNTRTYKRQQKDKKTD